VYYVAQTGIEPPTVTLVVNHPDMFTPNYLRFLSNRFREELPFAEVPIRIVVRARRQREDDLVSAEEGGSGHTIRIARGRKGVDEALAGNRLQATSSPIKGVVAGDDDLDALGDLWLSDEMSAPVDMDQFDVNSEAKAFGSDDAPEDDGPVRMSDRKARRNQSADPQTTNAPSTNNTDDTTTKAKPAKEKPAKARTEKTKSEKTKSEKTKSEKTKSEKAPSEKTKAAKTKPATPKATTKKLAKKAAAKPTKKAAAKKATKKPAPKPK
jgi:hypothetical protein